MEPDDIKKIKKLNVLSNMKKKKNKNIDIVKNQIKHIYKTY